MNNNKTIIKAEQKNIRISPRKLNLLSKAVRKLAIDEALDHLKFINKRSSLVLGKTIKQAVANATNNLNIDKDNLKISRIEVLVGPVFKRWQAVSRGRAHSILKRTSHLRVFLEEKETEKSTKKIKKTAKSKDKKTKKDNKVEKNILKKGKKSGPKS
ncbi:50S ribosomal protein L22 [Candidatus Beckwithbacteria bacterium CG10_big_fil_rev_8_21_14_0_10_34_10]|uniref:Large ribosomal subunit protein uL22 n=1 Tax=Candidatus Beckwithbacteria bacterium CG10_big_fil_rev_8_21_14_0_10_34_10 TaxID=1974495 RepID=A0A2H0W7T0_9BACT|nr:MAG: 50S ribosomal protein L22 [Candidatus Beckwithbacteria bacterium CG10_big_fil_rev_8_21_14_0_10_34_10]